MKAQVESLGPVRARLVVEVSQDEVIREEDLTYQKLRKTASVPGFRRGKVPVAVLKRLYRERVRSDVINRLIETTYRETLKKEDIVPVSEVDIQLHSDPLDGGLSYTAVFEIRPVVEPRGYRGLNLKKERVRVEETDVEARIETLRWGRAAFEPAPESHGVEEGDLVVIDYEGSVDGTPFEGGKGEDRSFIVGSDALIPGFEEQLRGMTAGQERHLEIDFPGDYRAAELAGKRAQFRVNLKDVKIRKLPEIDGEFAKEVAGVEGVEALRDKIREALAEERRGEAEERFRNRTVDTLLKANPFEVPESMIRGQQAHTLERMRHDMEERGLNSAALGLDEARVHEAHRRAAEQAVRWSFLARAIAKAEGIVATDEDVEERIRKIARADGRPVSLIRSFFEEEDRFESLRSSILQSKVIDRVVELGAVEEVDAGALEGGEEAP